MMSGKKCWIQNSNQTYKRSSNYQRLLKVWWLEIKDSLRDSIEFRSYIEGNPYIRVISVISWFYESLILNILSLNLCFFYWFSTLNFVRNYKWSYSVYFSSLLILYASEFNITLTSTSWVFVWINFWYYLLRWCPLRYLLLSRYPWI